MTQGRSVDELSPWISSAFRLVLDATTDRAHSRAMNTATRLVTLVILAIVAPLLFCAVFGDAVATAVAVVALGLAMMTIDGSGQAPSEPAYLTTSNSVDTTPQPSSGSDATSDRTVTVDLRPYRRTSRITIPAYRDSAVAATATVAEAPKTAPVRFLPPVWIDASVDVDTLTARLDAVVRLDGQIARALASRHRARAARYQTDRDAAWIAYYDAVRSTSTTSYL